MTTTEMLTALQASVEAIESRVGEADSDYEATRTKVQETAWELGWQHGIGTVMEEMLGRLDLQPRPARVEMIVKCEVRRHITDGVMINRVIVDLGTQAGGMRHGDPLTITQQQESSVGAIRLLGTSMHGYVVSRCHCADIEQYTTEEQRQQVVTDYWGSRDHLLLAYRCGSHECQNRERTVVTQEAPPEPEPF